MIKRLTALLLILVISVSFTTAYAKPSLSLSDVILYPGMTYKINGTDISKASWKSSNSSVVSVAGQTITARRKGKAEIEATVDGQKLSFDVTVNSFPDSTTLSTSRYAGEKFSINKPSGWSAFKQGGSKAGSRDANVILYDPDRSGRQIFYLSRLGPFYTNSIQYGIDIKYMENWGYTIQWLNSPVITPLRADYFFSKFNQLVSVDASKLSYYFPTLKQFKNIELQNISPLVDSCKTGIVRGTFLQNGVPCEGLFATSLVQEKKYTGYVGGSLGLAYMTVGVAAPVDEFARSAEEYIKVFASMTISSGYFATNQHTVNKLASEIETTWKNRDKSKDVTIQKWADGRLDKERVYNPATGKIYLCEKGFYSKYSKDTLKYRMKNLVPLPENIPELWLIPAESGSGVRALA